MRCCWALPEEKEVDDSPSPQRAPPPLPPRPVYATPPELPPRTNLEARKYNQDDLRATYAYLDAVINGDGFQACPPENFNDLCHDPEFADLVRTRADLLRQHRDDNTASDDVASCSRFGDGPLDARCINE